MTIRFNALLQTLSGISGFHSHPSVLAIHTCQTWKRSRVFYKFSTHDRPVTSLRGYGPTNNISIIQIIQNFLPVGSPLPQFLPPTALGIVTLSGPLIIDCECCEYVGGFVCFLEKKMGNAVATLHFQTLRQHPPSLKCFVQEGRPGK